MTAVLTWIALIAAGVASPLVLAIVSSVVVVGVGVALLGVQHRRTVQMEAELIATRVRVENAQRERLDRSEFFANIGAEIRYPISRIRAVSELAAGEMGPAQTRATLSALRSAVADLSDLIDDLVDFSQCEAGSLELKPAPFSVRNMVSDVARALGLQAQSRGLEFAVHIQSRVPYELAGDEKRIQHILINLVDNAIRFTTEGEIVLRVASRPGQGGLVELHFSVADTGPGMSDQQAAALFDGDIPSISGSNRSSISLAVCAELVKRMQGRIWVESEPGRGSTFHFTAALEKPRSSSQNTLNRTQLGLMPGLPVLVVDDNASTREILKEMLLTLEMNPVLASDASGAIEAIGREQKRERAYGVLLIDAQMPGEDGFALCQRVKSLPGYASTPVIVMTSQPEDGIRAIDAGAAATIEKPVNTSRLSRAMVSSVLGAGRYQQMRNDMHAAGNYVRALIPPPVSKPLAIDWRYLPAADLAGDSLGYHWIDSQRCAVYLLDVTGHGLDSALLSVSVLNVVKTMTLPDTDFGQPATVLQQLNNRFPMESHGDRCFSMWYGVIDISTRTLTWAGGGHPPALLRNESGDIQKLASQGPVVGMLEDSEFPAGQCTFHPGDRLYVYSDGVYEIERPDETLWTFDEFTVFMASAVDENSGRLAELWKHVCQVRGGETLEDDFTIVEVIL